MTNSLPLRAVIWAAVSTTPQANEEEKYSLPSQIADAETLCKRENWIIIDTLKVAGHSRNYRDLRTLARDARAKGIDAFDRLINHLEDCDFDVLICRDANRFARKASLLHYIVESIIEECGARIYSLNDGWVDERNADVWAMVKGYETSKQIKWLVESASRGKDRLAERGLPTGSRIPFPYRRIRDSISGKDVGIEVDESKRYIIDLVVKMLLDGVAFNRMGNVLYQQHGIVDNNGRPFRSNLFYEMFFNPITWGKTGRHYSHLKGRYIFDDDFAHEIPPGVVLYPNTVPALFPDEQAVLVRRELLDRMDMHGRAKPASLSRYSRLFVCGECGASLVVRGKEAGHHIGLRCPTVDRMNREPARYAKTCSQRLMIPYRKIDSFIDNMLKQLLVGHEPQFWTQKQDERLPTEIETTKREMEKLDLQIDRLIEEQSLAPDSIQVRYRERIVVLNNQREATGNRLVKLHQSLSAQNTIAEEKDRSLNDIRQMGLERFWQLPDREINQLLRHVLGHRRLVVLDREIVKIIDKRTVS